MVRHLARLTEGVASALDMRQLSRGQLALLQPASPAISMTAAMQVLGQLFPVAGYCWSQNPSLLFTESS